MIKILNLLVHQNISIILLLALSFICKIVQLLPSNNNQLIFVLFKAFLLGSWILTDRCELASAVLAV
jgi:hypothetical protein